MDERLWGILMVTGIVVLAMAFSSPALAESQRLAQSFPTIQHHAGGPPCDIGGSPDDKLCASSNQDNVAPLGEPWLTAVRFNSSSNWSIKYGAWISNTSAMADFVNVRAVGVDMGLDGTLHEIVNASEAGGDFRLDLEADTPYIAFTVRHIGMPVALSWRDKAIPYSYDASVGNGTLTFTLSFSAGDLVISFPTSTGSTAGMLPMLPGLTNFQPLDIVPNFGQVTSFSCDNVTLTDPRPPSEIANTRIWIFNWDDGSPLTTATVPTATHLYGTPGLYHVVMTVQNDDGSATGYAGTVDTTPGSCTFHVARGIVFVVLAVSSIVLLAVSFRPKLKKMEKRALRRKAMYAIVAVFVLVVVL